jgi:FkbM family methyltransferase
VQNNRGILRVVNPVLWRFLSRLIIVPDALLAAVRKIVGKRILTLVIKLPFRDFWFRPFFLDEWFMALGLWEPYVRDTLKIREGDVFIDVGAHIGYYSQYASKRVGTSGTVFCLEPNPQNIPILRLNVAAFPQTKMINAAASGHQGSVPLILKENPLYTVTHLPTIHSDTYYREKETHGSIDVPAITLDSLTDDIEVGPCAKVLLKIDVEGSEVHVLRGALDLISRYLPALVAEIYPENLVESKGLLSNYRFNQLFGNYYLALSQPKQE